MTDDANDDNSPATTDESNPTAASTRKRGRPPGAKNKPKDAPAANRTVTSDDNEKKEPAAPKGPTIAKNPLTDEQEHALTAHHSKEYEAALKKKKEADADFKNRCKLAKAEGVSLKQIKEYISYQTEEGQERLKEDLIRKQKVARWAGVPVGTQLNFLEEVDRTPIDERTKEDGKRAGLKGQEAVPPRHTPAQLISVWMEGWHEGQRILAERIKQKSDEQRAEDGKAFDDELPETTKDA